MNDGNPVREKQFSDLIERHHMHIRMRCWFRSDGDPALCAELVQDCYLDLWHHLSDLRPDASPRQERSWVAWRCRNVFSHRLRRRRRWWLPLDKVPDDKVPVADDSGALRRQVEEYASDLGPRELHYLRLYLDGYSNTEIAEKLNISVDSVYKMRRRVIDKMRQKAIPHNHESTKNYRADD